MTMAESVEHAHPESSEVELKMKSQSQEEEQEQQQAGGGEKAPSKWDELPGALPRKEKRKAMKRAKRKQARKEAAQKERAEEEARLNDPAELLRMEAEKQAEAEAQEKARLEFEERERIWQQNHQRAIEEAERKRQEHIQRKLVEEAAKKEEDENWEYVEDGPAEIIWQGNEIIVQKKKIRVPRRKSDVNITEKDSNQPISNPLPPQHAVFEAHKKQESSTTGLKLFDGVEQQLPNFGTEQDKAHCPFHIKTGACRFGSRCSRAHFYPNKSCTLLMKNMYNGPGLAWEQEEGLEYTDEEVGQHYDEFYEDVHTEFLKFGELVNFKVCKNSSSHLRGNVYVHYQSLDSAVAAYNAINGRYFAGKQITCKFVGVTRWKVAICGEYLKSRHKNCSHGSACNFLHCFRNPGGEYDWADWDSPPPRSWVIKMDMLFGGSMVDRHDYRKPREQDSSHRHGHSDRRIQSRKGYKSSSRRHKSHERDSWSCDDSERTPIRDHSSGSKYGSEEEREQRSDMDQTSNTYKRRENRKSCLSRGSTGKFNRGDEEISEEERLMHWPKRTKHQRGHASEDDNDDKPKSVFGADMDAAVKKQSRRKRESRIQYESDDDRGKLNSKNGETRERGVAKSSRRAQYQLEAASIEQKKINLSRRGHRYSHLPGKHKDHTRESANICEEKFQLSRRCHGHSHSPCEHKDDRKKLRRQRYSKSPRRNSHCASPRGDRDWSMSPKRRERSNTLLRRSRDLSKTPKRSSDEGSFDSLHRWQASDDTEF